MDYSGPKRESREEVLYGWKPGSATACARARDGSDELGWRWTKGSIVVSFSNLLLSDTLWRNEVPNLKIIMYDLYRRIRTNTTAPLANLLIFVF
jgi:hypothetical protein